ncbi:hypothetical protein PENTCL1PPCAC_26180, partial [Pristionchus entomophagus]
LRMLERGQKLFGITITPAADFGSEMTNKVLVLGVDGIHNVFYVLKQAFTLAPEAIEHRDGNEFDIVADIKNQVRRREKPLDVGDWISWFYSGINEIEEFRREHKLHELRVYSLHYQFLLDCVKSPDESCLYNHTFGYIKITPAEAHKLMTNISFQCWVDVYLDGPMGSEKVIASFHSYHTTDYAMQIKVLDSPWTEHHTVDMRGLTKEDEFEWLIEKKGEDKAKENNVYKCYGYYVSERSLYVPRTPDKVYNFAYINDSLLTPGVQYKFNAFWLEGLNCFIINEYVAMVDMDVLHTSREEDTSKILLLDTVNQRKDVKTLFVTSKCNFGTMDDPTGALTLHHLSRYAESKCRVFFYEDLHASFGRFRIERVELDKAKKIEKNVREAVTEVKGVRGVVISSEGRVFSAYHSPLRFFLPHGTSIPIGSHVVFTANIDHDTNECEAREETIKVLDDPPIEYFEYNGRLIFSTTVSWLPRGDTISGVVSLTSPSSMIPSRNCPVPTATRMYS